MKRCIIVGAGEFFGIPSSLQIVEGEDLLLAADGGYEYIKRLGIVPDLILGDFDSFSLDEKASLDEGGKAFYQKEKFGVAARSDEGSAGELLGDSEDMYRIGEAEYADENDISEREAVGIDIFQDADTASYLENVSSLSLDGIALKRLSPIKNDTDMLACVRIGIERGCTEFHMLGGTGRRFDHTMANIQILSFLSERGLHGYLYSDVQVMRNIQNESVHFGKEHRGYFSAFSLSDESKSVTERGFLYQVEKVTLRNSLPVGVSNAFIGREAEVSVKEGVLLLVYDIPR